MKDQLSVLLTKEEIASKVEELGNKITLDYKGKNLTVVIMLGGAFMFAADLVRQIHLPMIIKRITARSMNGTKSTGKVTIDIDGDVDFSGQDVLIIEDIVDTGLTISETIKKLKKAGVRSVKLCSLLSKPSKLIHKVKIDYIGFEVEGFVVGYGLDMDDKFRELPYVGVIDKGINRK